MGCDYYIQSELVIVFYDDKGALSITRTNIIVEKGYIFSIRDEDSDDDTVTEYDKFRLELERRIIENTYHKILYENDRWLKESYEKKYLKELKNLCPTMVKLQKIYKNYTAWERE